MSHPPDHPVAIEPDRHTAPRPRRRRPAPATPAEVQAVLPQAEGQPRAERVVPPVVYVPVNRPPTGEQPQVEFRRVDDSATVLLAYTALDRLVEGLGPHQPWLVVTTESLEALDRVAPYDAIMLDRVLPESLWHGAAS